MAAAIWVNCQTSTRFPDTFTSTSLYHTHSCQTSKEGEKNCYSRLRMFVWINHKTFFAKFNSIHILLAFKTLSLHIVLMQFFYGTLQNSLFPFYTKQKVIPPSERYDMASFHFSGRERPREKRTFVWTRTFLKRTIIRCSRCEWASARSSL